MAWKRLWVQVPSGPQIVYISLNYCLINETEEKITPSGLQNSAAKILPKGTLLVAMYGQGITRGKVALLGIEATTNQACVGIVPLNDNVSSLFLYYFVSGLFVSG